MYNFATVQQTSTAKLAAFLKKFKKILRPLRGNESKLLREALLQTIVLH